MNTGKRGRSTPTGTTPKQDAKRRSSGARRSLFSSPATSWSQSEEKALVEFIMLTSPYCWPLSMKPEYWASAAEFVHSRCGTSRTSK